jgi:uncharacterized Zn finger protein (UPF0148 family)
MSKFCDEQCPVCGNTFTETDDVVVCPDCGTPHHRSCYCESGKCANSLLHGREAVEDIFERTLENADGKQIEDEERDFERRSIFGASKAELSAFMQIERDSIDFVTRIEHIKFVNLNLFAGLLSPFYQFYKGMRWLGFAVLLPLCYFHLIRLVYFEKPDEFLQRFGSSPEQFASFASTTTTVMMLLVALFNDYVYLRYSAYRIRKIRLYLPEESQSGNEYYDLLRLHGAPSIMRGIAETMVATLLLAVVMLNGLI